jgi:hypothetical protein
MWRVVVILYVVLGWPPYREISTVDAQSTEKACEHLRRSPEFILAVADMQQLFYSNYEVMTECRKVDK